MKLKKVHVTILPFLVLAACSGQQRGGNIPGSMEQKIIFPLQYEHVHAPTIVELPNGDLLAAWFQGAGERWADDVRIMGARLQKGNRTWSPPFLMADTPGFPDINPVLFLDNEERLWLVWYPVIANQWETSIPKYRISTDYVNNGAPNWDWQDIILVKPGDKTERGIQPEDSFVKNVRLQMSQYETYLEQELLPALPKKEKEELRKLWSGYKNRLDSLAGGMNMLRKGRIKNGEGETEAILGYPLSRRIGWQTKNKPVTISDRIIIPLYSDGFDCSLFAFTDDLGKSWQFSNPVIGGIGIQPTIAISKNGSLSAYLRDNGPAPNRMQLTTSIDGGNTWSIAKDTDIPNPGAGFDMVTLESGEWVMVYNETEQGRHDLTLAVSDDEGKSWNWKKKIELDNRDTQATSSHYPSIIEGANGMIHLVYSYHHKDRNGGPHKTIKYATLPLSWVKQVE